MTELQYASLTISLSTLGQVDLTDNEREQLETLAYLLEAAAQNVAIAIEQHVRAQPQPQPKQIGRYAAGSRVRVVVADDAFTNQLATVRSVKRRNKPRRIVYILDVDDAPMKWGAGPYTEDEIVFAKESM